MTTRTSSAVVVRCVTTNRDGEQHTTFYGPFMQHAGSAVSAFIGKIDWELLESKRYKDWDCYVETVFIGPGESDLVAFQ